jgi:uncharacterized membrane protein
MAILYIVAGINHFVKPQFYLRIMPSYLPAHEFLNYVSGITEIILGGLLLFKTTRIYAAWGIAIMLLAFMVIHVFMLQQAIKHESYLITPAAAWIRLTLQFVLIAWAIWYTSATAIRD